MKAYGASARPTYVLSPGTQNNLNVRTALGSPSVPGEVTVIIGPGVRIGSTSTASPALRLGTGWPAGFTFNLTNSGKIIGAGGSGGSGGSGGGSGGGGNSGGDAMWLDNNHVIISNASGYLWCGIGGGGGGGSEGISGTTAGGGGGGGRGHVGGGGGGSGGGGASDGFDGDENSSGAGGIGGSIPLPSASGGTGGMGGQPGGSSYPNNVPGGSGGASGKAIHLGTGTATFLSGGSSPQLQGVVS